MLKRLALAVAVHVLRRQNGVVLREKGDRKALGQLRRDREVRDRGAERRFGQDAVRADCAWTAEPDADHGVRGDAAVRESPGEESADLLAQLVPGLREGPLRRAAVHDVQREIDDGAVNRVLRERNADDMVRVFAQLIVGRRAAELPVARLAAVRGLLRRSQPDLSALHEVGEDAEHGGGLQSRFDGDFGLGGELFVVEIV